MQRRCRNEVEEIHQFFQDWFTAAVENDDARFARVSEVLAPEFALVTPRGTLESRDSILDQIRGLHGARVGVPFRIWIEGFAPRFEFGDSCLVMYEEWQAIDGVETARWSTALFRQSERAPNGVEWTHLHETWLPNLAATAAAAPTRPSGRK